MAVLSAFFQDVTRFASITPFPTEVQVEISRNLLALGEETLAKTTRDLALAARLALGSESAAQLALGRALLPVARVTDNDPMLGALLHYVSEPGSHDILDLLLWCARFAQHHCPTLRLSAEQFAAFACTDVDPEALPDLKAPWPAFQVVFPDSAFPCVLNPGGLCRAQRIAAQAFNGESLREIAPSAKRDRSSGVWTIRTDVQGVCLWSALQHVTELATGDLGDLSGRGCNGLLGVDEIETRALHTANRVLLNTLIAMQAFEVRRTSNKALRSRSRARSQRSIREVTEYVIGAPVTVDMSHTVHCFLTGQTDRQAKVRWCVRGFWRNQPCGSGRLQRKRIWVAPHFAGRGPALIREHEITT